MADAVVPTVQWQYDPSHDARDGAEWSEAEFEELAIVLKSGRHDQRAPQGREMGYWKYA